MIIKTNRGQLGPLGEDILYYTFTLIAIALILVIAIGTFANHEEKYAKIDSYREALIYADKVAVALAAHYKDDESATWIRVMDGDDSNGKKSKVSEKLAGGDCGELCESCGVCVINRRTPDKFYYCGKSPCAGQEIDSKFVKANIRLPVAIKVSDKQYDPGVLQVTLVK